MDAGAGGNGEGDGTAPARHYANDLSTEISLSTCELHFAQRPGDGAVPQVQARIVTSPVHLVTFGRVIQATIARYEARFGSIPDGSG